MYMCPPHPSMTSSHYSMPPRYPPQTMPPYVGYQYPYLPNGASREENPPAPASNANQRNLHSPLSTHSPVVTQHSSLPHSYPPAIGQPYHGYPSYMHQYPMPLPTTTVK